MAAQFVVTMITVLMCTPELHGASCLAMHWPQQFKPAIKCMNTVCITCNLGADGTWHGSTGYFYLTYVKRFPMVYTFYSFKDTTGKVHTDASGGTETPMRQKIQKA